MKLTHWLYVIFVGIILAITTGFGVAAFYPEPQPPLNTYTAPKLPLPRYCYETPQSQASSECQGLIREQQQLYDGEVKLQQRAEDEQRAFRDRASSYTRTAVFFGVSIGAIYTLVGLVLIKRSHLVANGLLLAGVLTAVLTRLLVSLASLGAPTSTLSGANTLAFTEFGVLLILSVLVVFVGLKILK